MVKLHEQVRQRRVLDRAWRRIQANGKSSSSIETRKAVAIFSDDLLRNLERLQESLRRPDFRFAPQIGVAANKKAESNEKRPIVVAPIENRIIQRAILDVAQAAIPQVQEILETRTSVGGIPERGVGHALALIDEAIASGATYFIRSDISGFFTKIPRMDVIEFVADATDEREFVLLFESAITTELENINSLGVKEHRDIFPIGPVGVAQGSPLSPLIGNILLSDFDRQMNDRGITCIRYIDDFILLGNREKNVRSAFRSARGYLRNFDMEAYDPNDSDDKAEQGNVSDSFVFLGYQISPGLYMPSKSARQRIKSRVESILADGRRNLRIVASGATDNLPRYRYSHTLKYLNDVLKGWAHAFQHSNGKQAMADIDSFVDSQLVEYHGFVRRILGNADPKIKRRILGVYLLADTKTIDLPKIDE